MTPELVRPDPPERIPSWIRAPLPGRQYEQVRELLRSQGLHTVCREARCPNLAECWSAGTATLMLLGDTCTRRCRFCAVTTRSAGGRVDEEEPARVAEAVRLWGLAYVVLTMVCRDDLPDGGASVVARTVRALRDRVPHVRVELLTGDFRGDERALSTVLESRPEVFAHNLETVRRLSPGVRDRRASYEQSLGILRRAKESGPSDLITKSSLMLGLGETEEEIVEALRDLRGVGVDLVTLGQYLRPGGPGFSPVVRYVPPKEFSEWEVRARALGFRGVAAGPLVRSSYRADELYRSCRPGG
jgi:lipoic acid synthetase